MGTLSTQDKLYVNSEVQKRGKNIAVAYLLLIFLGTLGIHRFYLGKTGSGITQLVLTVLGWITAFILIGFLLIGVVGLWVIIDLFLVPGIIREDHERIEQEVTNDLLKAE
ncbi:MULTISPECIES: TM2 domain-containing protein [Gracilibacillus]|uniref:TM2 domain-containing protein n=1 Tax=Gracilibacillus TaxID=74385 RepID=UPI0008267F25|nr:MULTISPECIES: TM2 domain-containing protein [Gracilibacillus]